MNHKIPLKATDLLAEIFVKKVKSKEDFPFYFYLFRSVVR